MSFMMIAAVAALRRSKVGASKILNNNRNCIGGGISNCSVRNNIEYLLLQKKHKQQQQQQQQCLLSTTTTIISASPFVITASSPPLQQQQQSPSSLIHQQQHNNNINIKTNKRFMGSTSVRIICLQDLPNGKAYKDDVVYVKAGYARNLLIPRKIALYAIPANFDRLGMKDPDLETRDEKRQRLLAAASKEDEEDSEELKAADVLRKYLFNKVLKIWRNVDSKNNPNMIHPGMVTAANLKQKLSKQLQIDLEDDPNEPIHIVYSTTGSTGSEETTKEGGADEVMMTSTTTSQPTTTTTTTTKKQVPLLVSHDELIAGTPEDEQALIDKISTTEKCNIEIKQLGEYIAKISLAGGHSVPLKFIVVKR